MLCIIDDGGSSAIRIAPLGELVSVSTLDAEIDTRTRYLRAIAGDAFTSSFLGLQVDDGDTFRDTQPFLRLGVTCSEVCRRLSGVDLPGATWTPWQLYKELRKHNKFRNYNIFWEG